MKYLQRPSRLVFQQLALRRTIVQQLHVSAIRQNDSRVGTTSPVLSSSDLKPSMERAPRLDHPPSNDLAASWGESGQKVPPAMAIDSRPTFPTQAVLENLPGLGDLLSRKGRNAWSYKTGKGARRYFLSKSFNFPSFKEAWEFMTKIAEESERRNHHPELHNTYSRVNVVWSTHTSRSVTEKDIYMAKFCDSQINEDIMRDVS